MAAWFIPALKAILPHVGTIVGAATPVFTRKTAEKETDPLVLIGKQIAELQAAALQAAAARNADDTKELAGQLQGVVTTLEKAATETELRQRRAFCSE